MTAPASPHYDGPLTLDTALSRLALREFADADFTRDHPDADIESRDLGLAAATGGRMGARHVRAIKPFPKETGWHWHDMTGHVVYVLKGWISFRFEGVEETMTVKAGGCLSQPGGVPHNVVARSDDLELIEINLPASFGTFERPGPSGGSSA